MRSLEHSNEVLPEPDDVSSSQSALSPVRCKFEDLFLLAGHTDNAKEHITAYELAAAVLPHELLPFSSTEVSKLVCWTPVLDTPKSHSRNAYYAA